MDTGGELGTTLEVPRVTLTEIRDEFEVGERFTFAMFLVYGEAAHVGDDLGYVSR